MKKLSLLVLSTCILSNSIAHASISCPSVHINAICSDGAWQVYIFPPGLSWEILGESVSGQPCTSNEQADDVLWNYAFTSARMGIAGCNYSLFNTTRNKIGLIQIKSSQYMRTGNNWEKESYPGNWSCHESQETCLFSEK